MKKLSWILTVTVLVGLALSACAAGTPLEATKDTPKPGAGAVTQAAKPGWEDKWSAVLAKAKTEGAVAIYTHWLPQTRVALSQAFKDKYGLDLEISPSNGGSDLVAKVQAEKRAGIYSADLFGTGNTTLLISMKPEGLLGPIEPLLILPEVLDPKLWMGGKLPLSDKDGTALAISALAMHMVVYNTDQIKGGELTSYMDLLKPQYKGKIILHDPTVSGSGNAAVTHVGNNLWGEAKTADFLTRLIKDQQAVITRDYRLHMESVAKGKYAIGLAPTSDLMAEFLGIGAPVKMATVAEDSILTASAGAFGVPTKLAHPNAATVFINWLLTKEGQTIFARSVGNPSRRVDVTTEGMDPLFIPVPGKEYWGESEEALAARGKWRDIAKKVIDEAMK